MISGYDYEYDHVCLYICTFFSISCGNFYWIALADRMSRGLQ